MKHKHTGPERAQHHHDAAWHVIAALLRAILASVLKSRPTLASILAPLIAKFERDLAAHFAPITSTHAQIAPATHFVAQHNPLVCDGVTQRPTRARRPTRHSPPRTHHPRAPRTLHHITHTRTPAQSRGPPSPNRAKTRQNPTIKHA